MKSSFIEPAILELLAGTERHLKAQEVYQQLHPRFPAVNRSTIYRALERLARDGKISISDIGTGAAVYQKLSVGMHHHLICQVCGREETIDHTLVGSFFTQIQNQYQFDVITNHLILFGICQACLETTPRAEE